MLFRYLRKKEWKDVLANVNQESPMVTEIERRVVLSLSVELFLEIMVMIKSHLSKYTHSPSGFVAH